jgi:E3 ubiquitin-protein ligase TRIP12
LQDVITVCSCAFPRWCNELATEFAFLFPFETRRLYLNSTSFGIARAIKDLKISVHGQPLQMPRLNHNKVAISRQQILQAAQKVMELYAHHKAVLEVGYFNEVGVGAGPTLEFYTMVSHELQKRKHGLWLDQAPSLMEVDTLDGKNAANAADEGEQYVFHPAGLFPSLLSPNSERKESNEKMFNFVGRFVGKAILDGWQLDLPLSDPFLKVMTGEKLDWDDLRILFPSYEKSLRPLLAVCREKHQILRDSRFVSFRLPSPSFEH